MHPATRRLMKLCALFCCALAAVCADLKVGSPQPSFEAVQTLNAAKITPVSIGTFGPGPTLPADADKSMGVRAETLYPPVGRTFSQYLGDLLQADLAASGKLATGAPLVISGHLDHNELNAGGLSTNDGRIAATFVVTRSDGTIAYQKQLDAEAKWESGFLGAEAIPKAIDQYTTLYKTLLNRLFQDSEFQASLQTIRSAGATQP